MSDVMPTTQATIKPVSAPTKHADGSFSFFGYAIVPGLRDYEISPLADITPAERAALELIPANDGRTLLREAEVAGLGSASRHLTPCEPVAREFRVSLGSSGPEIADTMKRDFEQWSS